MRLFLFLLLMTLSFNANSYVYSVYNSSSVDTSKPTHVFVVGYPGALDDMFLRTAHSKIMKMDRLYPDHQKVLLMARGKKREQKRFIKFLQSKNYNIIHSDKDKISTRSIYRHLTNIKKIISLDVVSHNAAEMGIGLEKGGVRMTFKDGYMKKLVANFTEETYVVLHGCNSGFIIAPRMSEQWGVPVFGSLTSTDFQRLHNDGNWYFNNSDQHPSGGWDKGCVNKGGCVRMKPNNHAYSGHWGKYQVGLPFMRPFCAASVSEEACLKSRYKEMTLFPSATSLSPASTKEEFKNVVMDYLCPRNITSEDFDKCVKELRESETDTSVISFPFRGLELSCTKEDCSWRMVKEKHHRAWVPIFYQVNVPLRGQVIEEYEEALRSYDLFN